MKTFKNKILSFLVIFGLLFSAGNFNVSTSLASPATLEAQTGNFIFIPATPEVKVVSLPAAGSLLVRPLLAKTSSPADCSLNASDQVQSLFSQPASCFKITVARPQVSEVKIIVQQVPDQVPEILVVHASVLTHQLKFPVMPQPSASLPLTGGALIMTVALMFDFKKIVKTLVRNWQTSASALSFNQMTVLRC